MSVNVTFHGAAREPDWRGAAGHRVCDAPGADQIASDTCSARPDGTAAPWLTLEAFRNRELPLRVREPAGLA